MANSTEADAKYSKVLILGANGRMGRWAAQAFGEADWSVRCFARGSGGTPPDWVTGNARDSRAVAEAAEGCDVIVNALNPPYEQWAGELPGLTASVLHAARTSGATVILPGNVYNYGEGMPLLLTESTPHRPTTKKGRLREEMEDQYRVAVAAGVRTIVLRAGDFIESNKTGNWFDTYLTAKVHRGVLTYPGPYDIPHAWAYLPDLARAMVGLAGRREGLAPFETFGFPGHTFTAETLRQHASDLLGRPVRLKSFPWTVLRLMALFDRSIREVLEMRYLWRIPHQIDGTKLARALPEFRATPLADVLRDAWGLQAGGVRGDVAWSDT